MNKKLKTISAAHKSEGLGLAQVAGGSRWPLELVSLVSPVGDLSAQLASETRGSGPSGWSN